MKPLMPTVAVVVLLLAGMAEAGDISGQWARGDGKAKVQITPCGSDICAVNTWIKPGTPKEKEGDKLVMSIKQDGEGHYSGTAFDPQRDMSYKLTVTVSGSKMTTKGCVVAGLLCKGVDWTRVN
ncbi:DUF2147 domain-containing protein [Rhizobium sp. F40D2]|uniref:DUF2147 domain-containing protein n=1 Tax=Rhizobium sp. F40D2 TaxID=3453141 RepID=UPI003F1F98D6